MTSCLFVSLWPGWAESGAHRDDDSSKFQLIDPVPTPLNSPSVLAGCGNNINDMLPFSAGTVED